MCNPLMIAGAAVTAVGGIRQGVTARREGKEQEADLNYQAAVERDNAQAEAQQLRRQGERDRGTTLAAAAASGVKIGEGSVLDAEREVMQDAETDASMAILNGERRARGLNTQAGRSRRAGRNAAYTAGLSTASSLLSMGSRGMAGPSAGDNRSFFRRDDPYRRPGYVGGDEGE